MSTSPGLPRPTADSQRNPQKRVWLIRTLGERGHNGICVPMQTPDGTWHSDISDGLAFVKAQQDRGARIDGARGAPGRCRWGG
jgi:hypothetical protein